MGIAQGATPYLMITVEGYDLTDAAAVSVAIRGVSRLVNLGQERVTITTDGTYSLLVVHLTQEETLSLAPTTATIQVRWRDAEDEAHTTEMAQINIATAIYKGVI
jgi:hypothetical protein